MEPRLDSDLLRTFVAIAESGSFTRAAEQVGRTQSAVSMQMKKLEQTLGQQLFIREARGVRLARNGQNLITRARQILTLLDQTAGSLRTEPLEGNLRVGIPEEYGTSILPSVLAHFAESHPAVRVTVHCEASPALDQAIAKGDLDLAVVLIDSGQVEGEILVHDPTVWVTSASHAVHQQDPLPVAMYDHDCWWHDWALKTLDDRGRPYRVAYASRSAAGLAAAVTAGLAVAVLGQSTMPAGARVLRPEEGFTSLPGSSIMLRRGGGPLSRATDSMAEAIRDGFRQLPGAGGA